MGTQESAQKIKSTPDKLSRRAAKNLHLARQKPYRREDELVLMSFLVVTKSFTPGRSLDDIRLYDDGADLWRNYARDQYERANDGETLPPARIGDWRRVAKLVISGVTYPPDFDALSEEGLAEAFIDQDPRIHFPDLKASQVLWGRGFSMTILSQTVS